MSLLICVGTIDRHNMFTETDLQALRPTVTSVST